MKRVHLAPRQLNGQAARAYMPRRRDRPEDAGRSGRLGAKRLVGQSAAGQAHRRRALINRRKCVEPREMRCEGRSAPDDERRIFHKQFRLIGEVSDDHAAAMAVIIVTMIIMAVPIIMCSMVVIVPMGMVVVAMAESMIIMSVIVGACIVGVGRFAIMGMAVVVILGAAAGGEPESEKRKPY